MQDTHLEIRLDTHFNIVLLGNGPVCDEVQFSARDVLCEDFQEMTGVLFGDWVDFFRHSLAIYWRFSYSIREESDFPFRVGA